MKTYGLDETQDIVFVGSGPASLAGLHAAKEAGLQAAAIDKGPLAGGLAGHPTYMKWFSTAENLELGGFPLLAQDKNPTRREYLKYLRAFVRYFGLRVNEYRKVERIERRHDAFAVHARDLFGRGQTWRARRVVVATGFYDSPRMLGVPGEDLPHVSHRYAEAHYYSGHRVVVVGAGSSAAELALELFRSQCEVTVAMREERFQTKYWVEPDIENRIQEGSITAHRNVDVVEITPEEALVEDRASGERTALPCDFVLAMTGYEPDTTLIENAGAEVDHDTGKPILNERLESTVPGLYVAGTLCAGYEANVVFVENGREHGPLIVNDILAQRGRG